MKGVIVASETKQSPTSFSHLGACHSVMYKTGPHLSSLRLHRFFLN